MNAAGAPTEGRDDASGQPIEVVRKVRDDSEAHVRELLANLDIPAPA
jgi:hypothetical protein